MVVMDVSTLLQDLHFTSSTADGSNEQYSKVDQFQECHVSDKMKRTEQWVTTVQSQRKRAKSTDSYFKSPSVCDQLKKSFTSQTCDVYEEVNNVRVPEDEVKKIMNNVETEIENLRKQLKDTTFQDSLSVSVLNDTQINLDFSTAHRSMPRHRRSRTVSFVFSKSCIDTSGQESRCLSHSSPCLPVVLEFPRKRRSVASVLAETGCFSSEQLNMLDENLNEVIITEHSKTVSCGITNIKFGECLRECNENYKLRDQFRQENLFPTKKDLLEKTVVKLKPNKICGSYINVLDYLETHFYLLREDFLQPLREGIAEYQKKLKSNRLPQEVKNMKLYHNSTISGITFQQNQLCVTVNLDAHYRDKIGEKDFMFGSLVILTQNDFSDLIIGTVVSYEKIVGGRGKPEKGHIVTVHLHKESHFNPALKQRKFLMVESKAFFQTYYHVMKVLQNMKEDEFPMEKFIIKSQKSTDIQKPSYLSENSVYKLEDHLEVMVLEDKTWPTAQTLKVNESQLNAFKTALREELVVIQGPPGTGKTYLGCQVANALLKNVGVWNVAKSHPMLVVCQTNHALDQFMEQLIPTTENIIRVGSQSKSELLAKYNLRELRLKARSGHLGKQYKTKFANICATLPDLKGLEKIMSEYCLEASRMMHFGVVDLRTFLEAGVMSANRKDCFLSPQNFLEWLEEGRDYQVTHNSLGKTALIGDCVSRSLFSMSCSFHKSVNNEVKAISDSGVNSTIDPSSNTGNIVGSESQINFQVRYIITLAQLQASFKKRLDLEKSWEREGWNDWTNEASAQQIEERITFLQLRFAQYSENNQTNLRASSCKVDCLWQLPPHRRWELYRFWVNKLSGKINKILGHLEEEFEHTSNIFEEKFLLQNLELMRQADVVGMTTSAAARLYSILRELRAPIVIVEEAAEVHETHVVAAVSQHCQHLILLGDHKQLRPSCASYSVCKQYHTDVSLFERLLMNKTVVAHVLLTQHRMQPEVASLIRPHIYSELHDHQSTLYRADIKGMKKNVFFLSHTWNESRNPTTGSYSNKKEAEMAVACARYLLKQKYDPHEICILASYRAQVFELEARRNQHPDLIHVRVTSVDNFQGEESRIIILSLVRNNQRHQIGFLATENRTCVALSRARDGLYMLGNLNLLSERSALWSSVRVILERGSAVGQVIPLHCDRHPLRKIVASVPEDFRQYQEGGCDLPCSFTLQCQHLCSRLCHPDDLEHKEYQCQKPCERRCSNGHHCLKKCHENCSTCEVQVLTQLPCGHIQLLNCSLKPNQFKCQVRVVKTLKPCNHTGNVPCWVPASTDQHCDIDCNKYLQCGHICPLKCHAGSETDHTKVLCQKEVLVRRECGHSFLGKCYQTSEPCRVKVVLKLPFCNHNIKVECHMAKENHICTASCDKKLPCGHWCRGLCSEPCTENCGELVTHILPLDECGHYPLLPCWKTQLPKLKLHDIDVALQQECVGPCSSVLMCGHTCKGTCKQCKHSQIHIACSEICERKLICGHKCKASCSVSCPPCGAMCDAKCAHRKCIRRCGEPCTPCLEQCQRKCMHTACSRLCSEPCDVAPCNKDCPQSLACGHPCQGYCGEPCPDVCLACRRISGLKEESRRVKLTDCGCVIADELERKSAPVSTVPTEVRAPECPRCHSVVQSTLRYRELVQNYKNIEHKIKECMVLKIRCLVELTPGLLREVRRASICEEIKRMPEYKIVRCRLEELLESAAESNLHSLHIEMICFISSLFMECVKYVGCKGFKQITPGINDPVGQLGKKLRQVLNELEQHSHHILTRHQMHDLQHFAEHLLSGGEVHFKTEPTEDKLVRMWRGVWFKCSEGHAFPWTPFHKSTEGAQMLYACCQSAVHSLNEWNQRPTSTY